LRLADDEGRLLETREEKEARARAEADERACAEAEARAAAEVRIRELEAELARRSSGGSGST
jgi:hypothetical protein